MTYSTANKDIDLVCERLNCNMAQSTDEESGVYEIADILRNVDVRSVSGAYTNPGFETSFLMIEGRTSPASTYGDADGFHAKDESWKENWLCKPYKSETLLVDIQQANHKGIAGHAAILNTLKNAGVMIFIIDSKVSTTSADILDSVRNVLHHISKEERARPSFDYLDSQRCLLYRDGQGRFFNLVLDDYSASHTSAWQAHLSSFSCLQAASLVMILSRLFSCITQEKIVTRKYSPAFFAIVLGVVFKEEISHSLTNVAMMVRGMPSISGYSVSSLSHSDWMRKLIVFILIASELAGQADADSTLHVTFFLGLSLTILVLFANLGSRAWGFMHWKPIRSYGFLEPIVSFLAAAGTGFFLPFLGHRQVESGGKAALESTFTIAFVTALLFMGSDYYMVQKIVLIGSEHGSQDWINLCLGGWWFVASTCSLMIVYGMGRKGIWPRDEEPLLLHDPRSPVGFVIPDLPAFPINVATAQRGILGISIVSELIAMLTLALCMGSFLVYLSFTDLED